MQPHFVTAQVAIHLLIGSRLDCFLSGELDEGKFLLRDYINATVGFEELARVTGKTPKSLMRMLSVGGNPLADNLFTIIGSLYVDTGSEIDGINREDPRRGGINPTKTGINRTSTGNDREFSLTPGLRARRAFGWRREARGRVSQKAFKYRSCAPMRPVQTRA